LIADDCSNDGSHKIIESFIQKFPKIFSFIKRQQNLGKYTGGNGRLNGLHAYSLIKSKYIANCDGDDYWTDPYKLQKQVDYLEANPDCSFCFTDCQIEKNKNLKSIHPLILSKTKFDGIDFADQPGSIAQTCTWLVKRECFQNLPNWVKSSYTADWCMQIHFSTYGKGGYIPQNTAVYRIHNKGVWSKLSPFEAWRKNLAFYKTALQHLIDKDSKKRLYKRIQLTIHDALELANIEANKSEIRKWLLKKIYTCAFLSIKQTLHSLRLLQK
jgi:glycosyltransferase involved in cell wall biosynthesis